MKNFRFILLTEKGGFIHGVKQAKNKLEANFLITKEYIDKGFYNFKITIT